MRFHLNCHRARLAHCQRPRGESVRTLLKASNRKGNAGDAPADGGGARENFGAVTPALQSTK